MAFWKTGGRMAFKGGAPYGDRKARMKFRRAEAGRIPKTVFTNGVKLCYDGKNNLSTEY